MTAQEAVELLKFDSVVIDYTNWKGSRRKRSIAPESLHHGVSAYHGNGRQYLLVAVDLEDEHRMTKTFAVADIHGFEVT